MKAFDCVKAARNTGRPTAMQYIKGLCDCFFEMHGDRRFGDDPAIVAGVGEIGGRAVTIIGIEKGDTTREKIRRNFGSANPEGYRKALRQIRLAEKFKRPILCLVDTSGAYCGVGAEERGQGQAIAENMYELMTVKTPVLSIVIGEGGSGGALALAVADEVWMLEDAYYSVISPEGAASILWKDAKYAKEAAEALRLTAADLKKMEIIEKILPAQPDMDVLKTEIMERFEFAAGMDTGEMLEKRYQKFRKIGGGRT
ncbi:MAG: acetyl-CoA carboxylase carboxyl transferase subunit alpha [Clostridia bacterium]|nr:acetyl-CoA carboxylase carboxyl transferase subunit alpha [Clostridia bacterium]